MLTANSQDDIEIGYIFYFLGSIYEFMSYNDIGTAGDLLEKAAKEIEDE